MPERIQRLRTKGWRMPPNTIYVGRPGPFGNQFTIVACDSGVFLVVLDVRDWFRACDDGDHFGAFATLPEARGAAVRLHRDWALSDMGKMKRREAKQRLRGKNISCWCALGDPCHGDTWMEIANA